MCSKYVLATLILSTLFYFGHSIKCWNCRSDIDPHCGSVFNNATLSIYDCNLDRPFEGKSTRCQIMKRKVDGVWIYFRNCAPPDDPKYDSYRAECSSSNAECFTCEGRDGCNASSQLRWSPWFMMCLLPLLRR
ncbi:hypothetical protein PPYR_13849 [Photinus pyralis]|uniref:Uncharacterized protein n=1 Tax=Photinus pyralis TaxID=7054 RepID=A0A1Y1M9X8_PHOPY|nr:uncharacterized protein LOC116179113 [Photinus pyralis]XP_031354692.1 uncharacterized protein LOC116179118 [Photinus pyralis]KAB0794220.1 hypothetical protein PPYR_13840 [Photinus pyralis]KAB0794229.1 hypothetical protein PPYR_13849 [Photinus pyralis]